MMRDEDRELWRRVADSVRPLRPLHPLVGALPVEDAVPKNSPPPRPPRRARAVPPVRPAARAPAPKLPPRPERLDTKTVRRIAKGRLPIDGRLDLHGMTRDAAHARLLDFLALSRATGRRTVLVITGKGGARARDGTKTGGVLRCEVPLWLATPPFGQHVAGLEPAAPGHGGDGALYVRLRRSGA